jgi:hypothetical protein
MRRTYSSSRPDSSIKKRESTALPTLILSPLSKNPINRAKSPKIKRRGIGAITNEWKRKKNRFNKNTFKLQAKNNSKRKFQFKIYKRWRIKRKIIRIQVKGIAKYKVLKKNRLLKLNNQQKNN